MARLNEKDLSLLSEGKTTSMQGAGWAYLGGKFTENPNDYKCLKRSAACLPKGTKSDQNRSPYPNPLVLLL